MHSIWKILLKNKEQNFLKFDKFLFLGIALLIVCGIKICWNLQNYMDVLFWDESLYLYRGTCMFDFIPKDWGPSYSLWYKILSLFIQDKIQLYYFNFTFTTILISIALFMLLLLAKYSKTTLLKFSVMSFAFLICSYARPELFLPFIACFLLTIILFLKKNRKLIKIEIGVFVTLLCCFVFMFIFFMILS